MGRGSAAAGTPAERSASVTAFIAAGRLPAQPASPQPFTPSGLVAHGIGTVSHSMSGRSSARGRA